MNRVNRTNYIKKLLLLSCWMFHGIYSDEFTQRDQWGNTPLMLAIQNTNQGQALSLTSQMSQADFTAQDKWGNTALMWAIQKEIINFSMVPWGGPVENGNWRPRGRHRRKRDIDFDIDLGMSAWGGLEQPVNTFSNFTVAQAIINRMDQESLNIQDRWGNTALIWAVERQHADIALILIPKMSIAGLQLKDIHNETALDKMERYPFFNAPTIALKNILHIPLSGSELPPPPPPPPLDAVEKTFGDYLNPFATPPAQKLVKSITNGTKDLKNRNLTGADLSGHDWSNCDFTGAILNNANFSDSTVANAIFTGTSLQGTNFENCDITPAQLFSAQTFIEAWFAGNNQFQHADFTNKALSGCSFANCNLTGAIFDHALVQGTDFTGANLTQCSFQNAHLDSFTLFQSAILDQADFSHTLLTNIQIQQALSHTSANFSGCDFSKQNLMGINFSNCILTGANLTDADCSFSNFSRAVISPKELNGTKSLANANLSYLSLDGMKYRNKSLLNAIIRNSSFQKCDFTGSTLDEISITNSDFSQSILCKVSMKNPQLLNSRFIKTDFTDAVQISHADFTSCNVEGAIFDYSTPLYALFDDITVSDVQLSKAFGPTVASNTNQSNQKTTPDNPTLDLTTDKGHLILCPLDTSNLTQNLRVTTTEWQTVAQSSNAQIPGVIMYTLNYLNPKNSGQGYSDGPHSMAIIIDKTYPEKTFSMITRFGSVSNNAFSQWGQINFNLSFPEPIPETAANFKDFSHRNFSNQWIEKTAYDHCNFSYADLHNSYFKNCSFNDSNFNHANFSLANLKNCSFKNSLFSYATMHALLDGADFSNAVVDNASFELSTGFTGAQLMQTQKEHPGISIKGLQQFQHSDFSTRNFSGANISGANVSFSSFKECNLSNVNAKNAICTNSNFNNANLQTALFDQANLVQADLRGADFTGTSLKGADLRQAIFSSPDQLKNAITDKNTRLDKVLIIK